MSGRGVLLFEHRQTARSKRVIEHSESVERALFDFRLGIIQRDDQQVRNAFVVYKKTTNGNQPQAGAQERKQANQNRSSCG